MTSRQRWLATLNRQNVDRLPCDIWATSEVFANLLKHLQCADHWQLVDKLQIDAIYTVNPPYTGDALPENTDIWGIRRKEVSYGSGHYDEAVFHPLANAATVNDIKNHRWPSADWFDYSGIKEDIKKHSHRPIRAGYVEPFLIYSTMRGLEQAMIDMVADTDLIECAFDHIFDFATEQFKRILDAADGEVHITVPSEDLGCQTGPLFSLDCFRKLHKERFRQYIDIARQAGVFTFFHSDGACRDFIPDLIEIGVDILNPIQWRCPGMDRKSLKDDFGRDLIFHGGVDNQQTLPFGTATDVRAEVIDCCDRLGRNGGYICAPCHNIQPNTPVENILEMYKTILEISANPKYTMPQ